MSEPVPRLIATRAALPSLSSSPLGLLLGSYDPLGGSPDGGAPQKGGALHALLWAPLASLSSDPNVEEGTDALLFLQQLQQQQQQVLNRLIRQASLCCSHHLVGGLAVLGVWARVSAAAGQQQLYQQHQQLQQLLQLNRLACAVVAEGPLEGLNAADEAAAAALLQQPGSKRGPLKQPFAFVLLQQQQQQPQQDASVYVSYLSGGSSWSPLSAAPLLPLSLSTSSKQQQHKQQQQLLHLCCSPICLDLTLLVSPSLLQQQTAAALVGTRHFRGALRGALRIFAGVDGGPQGPPPFYCSICKGVAPATSPQGAPNEARLKGVPCDPGMTIGAAATAAAAAAAAAGEGADALQVEMMSCVIPSLCLSVTEEGVAAAAPFSVEAQQEQLPDGFAAVRCRVALEAVSVNPESQTLKTLMEYLIADWVRAAVGCIGNSLEEIWGDGEGPSLTSVSLISLQQRRHVMLQHDPLLLLQQQQAHGAAAVLAEFAAATDVDEGSERVRVEFLFGGEGRWGVVPALRLFSFPNITLRASKGAPREGEPKDSGALQEENDSYWRSLISSVRTDKLKVATSNRPWWMLLLPLLALLLSYVFERMM